MHSTAAHLPRALAVREQARRRILLVSIAALTLLSTSPVFGHHLARGAARLFAGADHWGAVCLVALHIALAPVHTLFHILLVAGVAYATWDRLRAWTATRRVLGALDARAPGPDDPFGAAAATAGLDAQRLRIVDSLPNPAFTVGWLRPQVYVASALAERLSFDELVAVLAHERAHLIRRDPLRLSVLRFFACTLFWIPALRRLAADVADDAEVRADDAAVAGEPLVLASAILLVARWGGAGASPLAGAVGFTCHDILERRVRRLAGEDTPVRSHVTRRSVAAAAVALALVWASGAVVAHPLPNESLDHVDHAGGEPMAGMAGTACEHHPGPGIFHLFCVHNGGRGAPHCRPAGS